MLKNLLAPDEPKDSALADIKEKLITHYKPKPPVIGQRFVFHQRTQNSGESINEFVMELRRLARTCEFGPFLDEALRDRFVCGLNNSTIQKKLLSEKNLTLQRAIDIAMAAEMAVLHSCDHLSSQNEPEVLALQQVCWCCGKQGHSQVVCRFRSRTCFRCGKKGHLQTVCQGELAKQRNKPQEGNKPSSVKYMKEEQTDGDNGKDDFALWTVFGNHKEGYHVHVQINNKQLQMELDTGAAVSVVSEQEWNRLFPTMKLDEYVGCPLRGYSGHKLEVKGQKEVEVQYDKQILKLPLVVIRGEQRPALLGRDWLGHLKLDWKQLHRLQVDPLEQILARYNKIFQKGIGTIVGYQADIRLKEGTKPIFKKCRSVAYALQPTLDAELERLQEEGILEPVQSSPWATPLVVVPKSNGKIRVCGDYKVTVNRCVETKVYPLPTIEDIIICKFSWWSIFYKA